MTGERTERGKVCEHGHDYINQISCKVGGVGGGGWRSFAGLQSLAMRCQESAGQSVNNTVKLDIPSLNAFSVEINGSSWSSNLFVSGMSALNAVSELARSLPHSHSPYLQLLLNVNSLVCWEALSWVLCMCATQHELCGAMINYAHDIIDLTKQLLLWLSYCRTSLLSALPYWTPGDTKSLSESGCGEPCGLWCNWYRAPSWAHSKHVLWQVLETGRSKLDGNCNLGLG